MQKIFQMLLNGAYYEKAVKWASSKGVVNGYASGKFGPDDAITREQLATMLWNYAKYKGQEVNSSQNFTGYKDAEKISWYAKETMAWAVEKGVVHGKDYGTRLDPQGTANRAEAAGMIYNYCSNIK